MADIFLFLFLLIPAGLLFYTDTNPAAVLLLVVLAVIVHTVFTIGGPGNGW